MNVEDQTTLLRRSAIVFAGILIFAGVSVQGQVLIDAFDQETGINTYYGLSDGNWVVPSYGFAPNAGAVALLSANGNSAGSFQGIGLAKDIGGIIAERPYHVSFWVTKYLGLQGIEFSDFSSLRIGGPGGTIQWITTPQPATDGVWVQWTGTYTPSPSDVGSSFTFEAIFDLDAMHAIALDGPIVAAPPPRLSIRCSQGELRCSQVELCWDSLTNRTYQVQSRSSLTTNQWVDLGGPILGNGSTNCVTDVVSMDGLQKYYQVLTLP